MRMIRLLGLTAFLTVLFQIWHISPVVAQTQSAQQGIVCTYKESADRKVTIYLKNGNVRAEGFALGLGKPGNVLLLKDALYVWNTGAKQGIIMPIAVSNKATTKEQKQSRDSLLKAITQFKKNCKKSDVASSVFDVPKGVTFTNYRQKFKNLNITVVPELTPANDKKTAGKEK